VDFVTISQIGQRLGLEPDRIAYLLRKAKIEPKARAGTVRLYEPVVIQLIDKLNAVPRYDLRHHRIQSVMTQCAAERAAQPSRGPNDE
jgi:DNA-binding transcriptional MerR regulator